MYSHDGRIYASMPSAQKPPVITRTKSKEEIDESGRQGTDEKAIIDTAAAMIGALDGCTQIMGGTGQIAA